MLQERSCVASLGALVRPQGPVRLRAPSEWSGPHSAAVAQGRPGGCAWDGTGHGHGGAVSSLLYATPPPVEVGQSPLGGGGGALEGGVQGGAMGGGGSGRGDGGGVGRVGWGGGVQVGQFGVVGGGGIGSRYLPLPSLMGES